MSRKEVAERQRETDRHPTPSPSPSPLPSSLSIHNALTTQTDLPQPSLPGFTVVPCDQPQTWVAWSFSPNTSTCPHPGLHPSLPCAPGKASSFQGQLGGTSYSRKPPPLQELLPTSSASSSGIFTHPTPPPQSQPQIIREYKPLRVPRGPISRHPCDQDQQSLLP